MGGERKGTGERRLGIIAKWRNLIACVCLYVCVCVHEVGGMGLTFGLEPGELL